MSYNNLSVYDRSLLENIHDKNIYYFCNIKCEKDIQSLGIKQKKLYQYSDKKGFGKKISYLFSQVKLLCLATIKRPKVIHFQWLKAPSLDLLLLKALKILNCKIVLTAHNVLPHDSGNTYVNQYKNIYNTVDKIISHTQAGKIEIADLAKIPQEKISVIPHGLLDTGKSEKTSSSITNHIDKKNNTIISVLGSISFYKGIDLIIDAWNQLSSEEKKPLHLIIAGKGEIPKKELMETDQNSTIINRFISSEEFDEVLKCSNYILLPYRKINQSGVLLTALNEKKKVIVSNLDGLVEPFQFGKIGLLIPQTTVAELKRAFIKADEEKDYCPTKKVWESIHEFYGWKSIGLKTNELYNSLI